VKARAGGRIGFSLDVFSSFCAASVAKRGCGIKGDNGEISYVPGLARQAGPLHTYHIGVNTTCDTTRRVRDSSRSVHFYPPIRP
jgi:hypothetical protein